MRAGRWVAVATALSMFGCSMTERISGASLSALRYRGPSTRSLVLEDPGGQRIRLAPGSEVRFIVADGRRTDWIDAGRLSVTEDDRIVDGDRELPIDLIETVEVKNVDGVKSYFLTVGIVAVAAALIALVVFANEGGGDSDSGQRGDAQPRVATRGQARRGPRVGVSGSAWFHSDPWLYPNQPAPGFVVPVGAPPPAPAATLESPNRLFTEGAVRRSTFAPLLQLELGYGFDARTGGGLSVGGGFAIGQMFELTGGFRLNDLIGPQQISMGYVRAGGNFPFEASDVFGAPIALDVAFNDTGFAQMRVIWGFRWRFGGRFEVAMLPANPQLVRLDDELYWDFPTTVQLGYRF